MAGEVMIGSRLRDQRKRVGLSQRELAQRVGVTASALSQVETDQTSRRSRPCSRWCRSWAFRWTGSTESTAPSRYPSGDSPPALQSPGREPSSGHIPAVAVSTNLPVVRNEECDSIELESGVQWERLSTSGNDVDFLRVTYPVGSSSSSDGSFSRHNGREYGHVLSGRLGVQIKFDEFELGPGDSVSFDAQHPHRLWAIGDEPVQAIWVVIGRASA